MFRASCNFFPFIIAKWRLRYNGPTDPDYSMSSF
jgi:hypothetical protein